MCEITQILDKLCNTREYDILKNMESCYDRIEEEQKRWYDSDRFYCPSGCGNCCHNFEPDLLEGEALYMASWLIENQYETALRVAEGDFPFDNGKTCPFFNKDSLYHCSIYRGRPCICRLFGASTSYAKNGKRDFKPCKHLSDEYLKTYDSRLEHRNYSENESLTIFKTLPPAMSDFMESVLLLSPDNQKTVMLREILPVTVRKLLWIISINRV